MAVLQPEKRDEMFMESVRFAKKEVDERQKAPVIIKAEEIKAQFKEHPHVYLVDPRLGFQNRTFRFWINRIPAGEEEGMGWKTLGHRHTVEAVIYVLQGKGHSIIDGVRYDWEEGDFISVPMFAWHRHLNTDSKDFIYVAATTGPLSLSLGLAVYEDERYPEYWVFGGKGEKSMQSLIPGAAEGNRVRMKTESDRPLRNATDALYEEHLLFASGEEKRRRGSQVLKKGKEIRFEATPMGRIAYVIDPRTGFVMRVLGTLLAEILPGKSSGAHQHMYEEVNYVLSGEGYSIIEDKRYDWGKGDVLCLPVFSWHQHFNTGKEPARFLVHHNRPLMENLGFMYVQQGEEAVE
ncbi:MAG TPA: cupin domain-containing protein [Candidatus Binatia bacterium]